jgi:peptide-methionine (R)-S-oxide reductase
MAEKVVKSDAEWRAALTPEQYAVCRRKGTERAFTGKYHATKADGIYRCACCGNELFDAKAKYDSGTGWPSFSAPLAPDRVRTETDRGHGMLRTEVLCARCDAHLGHVFPDGPAPTGERYCMNSVSLDLAPREAAGRKT